MSRKKKKNNPSAGSNSSVYKKLAVAVIAVAVSLGLGYALTGGGGSPNRPDVIGGEKRPTMSPAYFVGKTAKAYKAAKEIPQVLDKIYCYCKCQHNFGHKSLLTCFTDKHGAECGICMDEAIMAHDLHKKGYSTEEIVSKVDSAFDRKKR
ncbi:MAG: PCYCGC domain-containing protein [Deltaproteobacteria bacterium]|nr:PCYCGC domain-containing protein [Deltaproteobacteria bacterium]